MKSHDLPESMEKERVKIEKYAQDFRLDFFPVIFQLMDYEEMSAAAAYDGFPSRYPYWLFGMQYEQIRQPHIYGLSTIYEMVINTNPCYAYLLDCNNMTQQKTVIAHVYGHADFFKNNYRFAHTNRKTVDEFANHATKIRNFIDRHGIDAVESFIDLCMSLENLIDTSSVYTGETKQEKKEEEEEEKKPEAGKFKIERRYMDVYINPKEALEKQRQRLKKLEDKKRGKFPAEPERDVLRFLSKHAPLKPWQKSILDIIREEMYYFAPQGETKILNEGWAAFCHSSIMSSKIDSSEIMDYADFHSYVASQQQGRLNPYALGLALLLDIEERWNKGRHGKEYKECEDMEKKRKWDTGEMKGREKLFEVRKLYSDITFIDEFLTPEFCAKNKLFTFSKHEDDDFGDLWLIDSRQFKEIKEKLLFNLTNSGSPFVYITDANYKNRSELLLHHKWTGVELDFDKGERALQNLEKIWKRPVNLETCIGEKWCLISCKSGDINYDDLKGKPSYKY